MTFGIGPPSPSAPSSTWTTTRFEPPSPPGSTMSLTMYETKPSSALPTVATPGVLAPLLDHLRQDSVGSLAFAAATYLADPTLLPVLTEWHDALPGDTDVVAAVEACDPERQLRRFDLHQAVLHSVQAMLDDQHPDETAALW